MKVKIPKNNITTKDIAIYNKPQKIYIPMISGNDTNITILVSIGEYVYKGTMIGKRKGDFRIPICSSVSGTVVDFEERTCFNGDKVKCVVIENDFKEKIEMKVNIKKNISDYTKGEFLDRIRECGIVGMGGAGFPTYVKYENKQIETLIINAVECEPFITADERIIELKCEEILEAIDAILEINNIKEAIIAIKKSNTHLKTILDNYIGTYLKIKLKLVSEYYPIGWERALVRELLNKEYPYYPSEVGVVVNNVSTIYAIYEALKYNKPLIERIVTISGNLDSPKDVFVKIGTPISDIVKDFNLKGNALVSGGPLMGTHISDDDLVISANQACILSMDYKLMREDPCLNCGKCVQVCPAKLSPVMIMKKNKDYLRSKECIECGLCSYICPAKINVREYVRKHKRGDK